MKLTVGLMKKNNIKRSIFQSCILVIKKIKVELDLSNSATNSDLKAQQVLIHQNLLKKMI